MEAQRAITRESTGHSQEIDTEKVQPAQGVTELGDDPKAESDNESARKQEGVKKVEAVTTVWTKKTLITMFAL